VLQHLQADLARIEREGAASVTLAGRTFRIRKAFIDDARALAVKDQVANLRKALLVLHAPADAIVGIEHATAIFTAARHPKSFVSLDTADHLLTDRRDAAYAAEVIAAWASRFLPEARPERAGEATAPDRGVVVAETGAGKFQNSVAAGGHRLLADEPTSAGGLGSGPTPYDYLAIALGACTSMTLRLYAEHKQLPLGPLTVGVTYGKVPAEHCQDCGDAVAGRTGKIDRFERTISVAGGIDAELAAKLAEIAAKCPVHRTLEAGAAVVTRVPTDGE
jgi:putative redox protein